MSRCSNPPLSEYLRPKQLSELAISAKYISRLQAMLHRNNPANMLFFGSPGTGKTSAARIFCQSRGDTGVLEVDGSKDTGIDYIRNVIEAFTTACAFTPGYKIVFIDDGDYLTKQAQGALRGLIERSSATCRFIVAVNDVTTIDRAIRSRLLCLHFAAPSCEVPGILKRTQEWVAKCLTELDWSFDRERLNQIVAKNLFDLRAMANKIEFEFRR